MTMTTCSRRSLVQWFLAVSMILVSGHQIVLATMPSAPMEMSLQTSMPIAVDTDFTITLTARPLIDAPQLVLTVTLPDGVDLIAGDTTWRGPAAAGDVKTLILTARPRKADPAIISGAALIELADGAKLGDTRSVTLPLGDRTKPRLMLPPPKKTQTGEPVIEYRDAP